MANPKCPYCGRVMARRLYNELWNYKCPECGASSPECVTREEAYAAAMKRERPKGYWMTKEYMYGDHSVGQEDMWIERLAEYGDQAYCSVCGEFALLDGGEECKLSNFCPNCGADMRKEEK